MQFNGEFSGCTMLNTGPRLQQSFPAKPVALSRRSSEHDTFSFTYDNLYKCLYQRNESEDQTTSGNVNDCTERKGNNLDILIGYDYEYWFETENHSTHAYVLSLASEVSRISPPLVSVLWRWVGFLNLKVVFCLKWWILYYCHEILEFVQKHLKNLNFFNTTPRDDNHLTMGLIIKNLHHRGCQLVGYFASENIKILYLIINCRHQMEVFWTQFCVVQTA